MSNPLIAQVAAQEIEAQAQNLIDIIKPLSEAELWTTNGKIPNSIGTLTRHLTGNLNHYFGAGLLKNGYQRERDQEFSQVGLTRTQVIADLQAAVELVKQSASAVDAAALDLPFTSPDGETYASLSYYIMHMTVHFAMHCGQADYAQHFVK